MIISKEYNYIFFCKIFHKFWNKGIYDMNITLLVSRTFSYARKIWSRSVLKNNELWPLITYILALYRFFLSYLLLLTIILKSFFRGKWTSWTIIVYNIRDQNGLNCCYLFQTRQSLVMLYLPISKSTAGELKRKRELSLKVFILFIYLSFLFYSQKKWRGVKLKEIPHVVKGMPIK